MNREAEKASPGSKGLIIFPHFLPFPDSKGMAFGLTIETKREEINRAILEGYGYEVRRGWEEARKRGIDCKEIRVIGGGAKSSTWNQIKADVLGVPCQRLKRSEFATWGSAMIAGRAVGLFDDLAMTATATTEVDGEPVRPRPDVTEVYRELADRYVGWQERLSDAFRSSADDQLWGDAR